MDEDTAIPKHGHNNPEEAVQFLEKVMWLVDRFMDALTDFDRHKQQDGYLLFIHDLHQLLVNLDQTYFKHAKISLVFDLIDDKLCRSYTEQPRDDDPLVIKVGKYMDKIPHGQDVCTKMVANLKTTSLNATQQADDVKLFNSI